MLNPTVSLRGLSLKCVGSLDDMRVSEGNFRSKMVIFVCKTLNARQVNKAQNVGT